MQSIKRVQDGQKSKKAENRSSRPNTKSDNRVLERISVHAVPIGVGGEKEATVGGGTAATTEKTAKKT